jgi:RimJ/RimL family protein N-acetyltransferase
VEIFLETDRLVLRQFTEDDVDNLFDLNSDPEVMRYLTKIVPTPRESFTELGIRRVSAHTMAVNLASRRVMEKAGLRFARTFYPSLTTRSVAPS